MTIELSDPRHGTRAGYIAGCRETCCSLPHYRYQKAARLRMRREGTQVVPATALLERMAWWADHGVTPGAVQRAAGVGEGTLRELVAGERDLCLRSTERAVLAVTWDDLPGRGHCSADLTRVRVHSMLAAGHTLSWVSEQTAGALPPGGRWRHQRLITLNVARTVAHVYETAPLDGPSKTTAVRSRNRGYLHPLEWDDPGTPAAPSSWSPVATRDSAPRAGRPATRAAVVEDFDFLVATGSTAEHAAERVGVAYSTVRDYRRLLAKEAS